MSGTVIAFVVLALAIGALVGWLLGSRQAAAARQVTENLRLQLDAVTGERDAARPALQELAALKAAQQEREIDVLGETGRFEDRAKLLLSPTTPRLWARNHHIGEALSFLSYLIITLRELGNCLL